MYLWVFPKMLVPNNWYPLTKIRSSKQDIHEFPDESPENQHLVGHQGQRHSLLRVGQKNLMTDIFLGGPKIEVLPGGFLRISYEEMDVNLPY